MKRGYACLRRADGRIRLFCRRLTRRQRSLVAITAFLLFLAVRRLRPPAPYLPHPTFL